MAPAASSCDSLLGTDPSRGAVAIRSEAALGAALETDCAEVIVGPAAAGAAGADLNGEEAC